jgi:hypothetical protein
MSGFILTVFLDACKAKTFQNKWMSAQSWSDLIMHNFFIRAELQFTGSDLVKAVSKSHNMDSGSTGPLWNILLDTTAKRKE